MATYTNKLNLIKPEINDLVSPTVFADNFDKIDAAYGGLSSDLATTDSNLEKLNSNLDDKTEWKEFGRTTGNGRLTLPNGWKEIKVFVYEPSTNTVMDYSFINQAGLYFGSPLVNVLGGNFLGKYSSYFNITNDSIGISIYSVDGVEKVSNCKVIAYYK